ncbi:hypothetical protein CSE45_3068 [Citreicella sp. SE45]|nr:hypothetical protein CSE45_3068 [Citreicella sp. SE45]
MPALVIFRYRRVSVPSNTNRYSNPTGPGRDHRACLKQRSVGKMTTTHGTSKDTGHGVARPPEAVTARPVDFSGPGHYMSATGRDLPTGLSATFRDPITGADAAFLAIPDRLAPPAGDRSRDVSARPPGRLTRPLALARPKISDKG